MKKVGGLLYDVLCVSPQLNVNRERVKIADRRMKREERAQQSTVNYEK